MSARPLILIASAAAFALLAAGCGSSTGGTPAAGPSNSSSGTGASAPWTPPAGATEACQFEAGILAAITGVGSDVSSKNWSDAAADLTYLQNWISQAQGLSASSTVTGDLQTLKADAAAESTSVASSDSTGAASGYRQLYTDGPALISACG